MNVLLIWNEFDYGLTLFFLEGLEGEELEVVKKANGSFINGTEDRATGEALDKISSAVAGEEDHCEVPGWARRWKDRKVGKVKLDEPFLIEMVVECGFLP